MIGINDTIERLTMYFFLQFPRKRDWVQQLLEGAAFYISRGRIVCSKRVPEIEDDFYILCHPYY